MALSSRRTKRERVAPVGEERATSSAPRPSASAEYQRQAGARSAAAADGSSVAGAGVPAAQRDGEYVEYVKRKSSIACFSPRARRARSGRREHVRALGVRRRRPVQLSADSRGREAGACAPVQRKSASPLGPERRRRARAGAGASCTSRAQSVRTGPSQQPAHPVEPLRPACSRGLHGAAPAARAGEPPTSKNACTVASGSVPRLASLLKDRGERGGRRTQRTSRPSPTSSPKKPSSAAPAEPPSRPSATRVAAQRAASGLGRGHRARPAHRSGAARRSPAPAPAYGRARGTPSLAAVPASMSGRQHDDRGRRARRPARPATAARCVAAARARGRRRSSTRAATTAVGPVQVRAQPAGPFPEPVGVAARRGEQLLQQLAADPALRLGRPSGGSAAAGR